MGATGKWILNILLLPDNIISNNFHPILFRYLSHRICSMELLGRTKVWDVASIFYLLFLITNHYNVRAIPNI